MCSDQTILPVIKIIQSAFLVIEIVAPIVAIVSFSIIMTKMMIYPDEKKLPANFKNALISLVVVFIIPILINITMLLLGENFEVSACWKEASNYEFTKGNYIKKKSNNKVQKLNNNKKYEVGDPADLDDKGNLKLTSQGTGNQQEWINTLEETADKLIKMRAHYYGSARGHSLEEVKKTHDVNCASYISLAMQEFGLLPRGKVIYVSANGVIKGDGASYLKKSKKVTISYPDKKASQLNLKPGDILGFDKSNPHTFAYAGKKNGKYLWYTAGPGDVSEKNYGPKTKRYNNKIIGVVIRPKYNSI